MATTYTSVRRKWLGLKRLNVKNVDSTSCTRNKDFFTPRDERVQGKVNFSCSADHVQDWQTVDPYSCYIGDHTCCWRSISLPLVIQVAKGSSHQHPKHNLTSSRCSINSTLISLYEYSPVVSTAILKNCTCTPLRLKKNLNAFIPSEYPPVRGENVKTFRWDHRLQINTCSIILGACERYNCR